MSWNNIREASTGTMFGQHPRQAMPMKRLVVLIVLAVQLPLCSGFARADTVSVQISGLDSQLRDNARAFLTIENKTREKQLGMLQRLRATEKEKAFAEASRKQPTAQEIARWHKIASDEIAQSLQPFGYYNPTIDARLSNVASGEWVASYSVTIGARSHWREISVVVDGDGHSESFIAALRQDALVRAGQPVDHRVYENYKRLWTSRLYDEGYLDARFEQSIFEVDAQTNKVDLRWAINTGPRYRFGDIRIQQDILKPSLVNRYHSIMSGDAFDTDRLIELQLKLNDSNYFESVALDIRKEDAVDGRVPVVVNTTPRKRRRYDFGLGYGTDTGPRVTAGLESRRVNKRGHRYRINSRASQIESALQFEYDIPIKDVAVDRWRLYAQVQQADVGDADATQYSLGAAREDAWWGMRRRLFLNVDRTNFSFGDEPQRSATLVYPGINLSFNRLDNPRFVRRGFSLASTLQGGADALGSATDFLSLQLSGRGILPLGNKGRLLGAADAKLVEAKRFASLPPSQRFFLGGDRSVRGYAFQSISPENAAGDDIGGSRSLNLSLEADYQVAGNWGLATFFDAGDVSTGRPTDFKKSVGLGLRYRSPVGMIRIDVAHPLDDANTDVRFHLSIGPDL